MKIWVPKYNNKWACLAVNTAKSPLPLNQPAPSQESMAIQVGFELPPQFRKNNPLTFLWNQHPNLRKLKKQRNIQT